MASFPTPGKPVRGSRSGASLMALFDLLGRSWSMSVLWQLCEGGPATFRDLQARCERISPTVLNQRLKQFRQAGFVETSPDGYRATALGRELYQMLVPMRIWSRRWATRFEDDR